MCLCNVLFLGTFKVVQSKEDPYTCTGQGLTLNH